MRFKIACLVVSLLLVASHARGARPEAGPTAEPAEILIAAAASLAPYCQEAGRRYEARSEGVRVWFTFASSGHLRQQIEAGAPADGFISASNREMDLLEEKGLVDPSTRLTLARNRLALVVPKRGAPRVEGFSDLAGPSVASVALGDPSHVPAGYYGRGTLRALGLWDRVKPKLIYGLSVRQVLQYVVQGEVDAGLVYLSDARSANDGVRTIVLAPEGSHPRISYPMAVLSDAAHPRQTEAFFSFLRSSAGQGALVDYGLQPVLKETSR